MSIEKLTTPHVNVTEDDRDRLRELIKHVSECGLPESSKNKDVFQYFKKLHFLASLEQRVDVALRDVAKNIEYEDPVTRAEEAGEPIPEGYED